MPLFVGFESFAVGRAGGDVVEVNVRFEYGS